MRTLSKDLAGWLHSELWSMLSVQMGTSDECCLSGLGTGISAVNSFVSVMGSGIEAPSASLGMTPSCVVVDS